MRRFVILLLAVCLLAGAGTAPGRAAVDPPLCPTATQSPEPGYAALGARPNVAAWQRLAARPGAACGAALSQPSSLAAALAARFRFAGGVEDLAERIGAVSRMEGLMYWSTTDQRWRELIIDSSPVVGPDDPRRRSDFTAREVLAGRNLYFEQEDSRSTGRNLYRMAVTEWDRSHLVFEVENMTAIRFAVVSLYSPFSVTSTHFLHRLGEGDWAYYGLSVLRDDSLVSDEASLVNRADAFYRFLSNQSHENLAPLAR